MTKVDIDELRDALHRTRGYALMGVRQGLPENPKQAVSCEGEMYAYRRMLTLLEHYERDGEWPDRLEHPVSQSYQEVSEAIWRSDELNKEDNGGHERGVE